MRDSDPPKCRFCDTPLRKRGERHREGTKPDDLDYVAALLYRCTICRVDFEDRMDGEAMTERDAKWKKDKGKR